MKKLISNLFGKKDNDSLEKEDFSPESNFIGFLYGPPPDEVFHKSKGKVSVKKKAKEDLK